MGQIMLINQVWTGLAQISLLKNQMYKNFLTISSLALRPAAVA